MTTIFKGSTNGGANRFFVKDEKVMVAGADVKGRQEVNIDILSDVWGFDVVKNQGPIQDDFTADAIRVFQTEDGDWRVQIGPENVNGNYVFSFGDDSTFYKDVNAKKIEAKLAESDIDTDGEVSSKAEGAAMNFALFLEQMLEADALKFIEDAGADPSIFTDDEAAIATARYREKDGDVIFSGNGVGGRTTTDEFDSRSQAENFIDTIQLAGDSTGFLDDILV